MQLLLNSLLHPPSAGPACRIAQLPAQLLSACSSLSTLCAHQNPITVEDLRTAEGYAEYEAR
jgi:hypothetical protein